MSDDLISRKELGAAIDNWLAIDRYYHPYSKQKTIPVSELIDIIKLLPSAQRTGRWIDDELMCKARCSVCGEEFSWMDNDMDRFWFCPNCGARMEEQDERA